MRAFIMSMLAIGLTAGCSEVMGELPHDPSNAISQCSVSSPCNQGEVCHFEMSDSCGSKGQLGTCLLVSQMCLENYSPVCGCDGLTYSNACKAHANGVSPRAQGACEESFEAAEEPPNMFCDSSDSETCPSGMFCRFSETQVCGETHQTKGECAPIPTDCMQEQDSVCGCDGNDYINDCVAHAHGVSVRYHGSCESVDSVDADESCDSDSTSECSNGLFCDYAVETNCGAYGQGHCKVKPEVCTQIYSPVCGCDGRTYSNACSANGAGVAVKHSGECSSTS